jgi:predicted dehydrogenase
VLGAGSIGTRHARNLVAAGARVAIADVDEHRARSVDGAEPVLVDLGRLDGYDGIVVATPTSLHHEHALAALAAGATVLVEKPLVASERGLDELLAAGADRIMVGYNLRLHRPVERMCELVRCGAGGPITFVRLWFGRWLPDWRPGADYRVAYSARHDLGGGVLRDGSHEIDLLVWMFGRDWDVIGASMEHRSRLEIDVEDVVLVLLRSGGGVPVVVTLDSVSRRYRRGIEVIGEDATLRLDWARGVIEIERPDRVTVEAAADAPDESYQREAMAFLDFVRGVSGPVASAEDGAATVRVCARIEEIARRTV